MQATSRASLINGILLAIQLVITLTTNIELEHTRQRQKYGRLAWTGKVAHQNTPAALAQQWMQRDYRELEPSVEYEADSGALYMHPNDLEITG